MPRDFGARHLFVVAQQLQNNRAVSPANLARAHDSSSFDSHEGIVAICN
jgi:hypothetical protein